VALNTGGGTINVDDSTTLTLNGNVTGAAGNNLTKIGPGTLVLGGSNSYGGDTRVDVGTLRIGAAGALSPNTHLRVQPGAIFDPNGFATSLGRLEGDGNVNLGSGNLSLDQAADTIFTGIIGGTGGLAKSGAGRLTLSGAHTFTGATSVTAGELRLNGSAANSAFTVTGGRLSGSGTLGQLTLGNGGILAPGNSPGTLSTGETIWESGGAFEWEVNDAAGIVSTNWDLLNVTGGLTITATDANPFSINLVSLTAADIAGQVPNFNANANASWTFVTTTTGITFGAGASIGASFALNSAGFQNTTNGTFGLALLNSGNDLAITYTTSAVPEPGTFALIFSLLAIGFAGTRRRRHE
jgi:autotransporter-associated beta strand protein